MRLNAALYLVKLLVAVSNETSTPTDSSLLPKTPERLTIGLEFSPTLALTPANSCKYRKSSCYDKIRQISCFVAVITMLHIKKIKKMEGWEKYTFPDLWSGTTKLRIDFSPGVPNPSTVNVVKS
jgi:hypothetical protein